MRCATKKHSSAGVIYKENGEIKSGGEPLIPENINTIPDKNLLYKFKESTRYDPVWPQMHASKSCPHNCDYCVLVAAFGGKVRTRPPKSVADDIEAAIEFFSSHKRLVEALWITDDKFLQTEAGQLRCLTKLLSGE